MDFFEGIGSGGIDIQDMIECDIKSEFNEQCKPLTNGDPMVSQPLMIPINISLPSDFGITLQNGITTESIIQHLDTSEIKTEQDFSWLQPLDTSEIQNVNVGLQDRQPENTDPNLMVNPQTGLPVSLSNNTTTQTIVHNTQPTTTQIGINRSIGNALLQAQETATIQYVNVSNTLPNVVVPQGYTIQPISQATVQPQPTVQTSQNYHQTLTQHLLSTNNNQQKLINKAVSLESQKTYPKPAYSYSCLIAMALKNSDTGALPVSEIYSFMTENFPYFKTAPDGWKNSVRHNLSLNKCFEKIENPRANGNTRKGCLWGLNPAKIEKMEEEIVKWRKKDTPAVKRAMSRPEKLELLEKGNILSNSPRHPNNIRNHGFSIQIPSPPTPSSTELQSPAIDIDVTDDNQSSEEESNPLPSFSQQVASVRSSQGSNMHGTVEVSMVELEPNVLTESHIKEEPHPQPVVINLRNVPSFTANNTTTAMESVHVKQECININSMDTDGSIAVDPTFTDLSISQTLWDELSGEGINLEDIPISAGFSLSFAPNSLTSSPATVQNSTGIQCM